MAVRLKHLESILYRLITAPSGVAEGLAAERRLPAGGLDAIVRGDDRLSAEDRVDIYANMYFYRLLDVLKEDFPATLSVLGDDNFHNLATGYLLEYPPTEPSVLYCGRHLAAFLRDHPPSKDAPYLADLATARARGGRGISRPRCARARIRTVAHDRSRKMAGTEAADASGSRKFSSSSTESRRYFRRSKSSANGNPPDAGIVEVIVWRRNSRVFYRELENAEAAGDRGAAQGRHVREDLRSGRRRL